MFSDLAAVSLGGLQVLVTRPHGQAAALCDLIRQASGHPLHIPVIEICPPHHIEPAIALIDKLDEFDLAVFISSNAVSHAHQLVSSLRAWPEGMRLAVIGKRSAEALRQCGLYADLCPAHGFNSESLLAMEEMWQLEGKKIIIFRGEGGRELLAQTLSARGASVVYAEVYRRAIPENSRELLNHVISNGNVDIIIATSNEGLQNLYDMVRAENRSKLLQKPLVLISHRGAMLAEKLGFSEVPVIAPAASDGGLVAAIKAWYAAR